MIVSSRSDSLLPSASVPNVLVVLLLAAGLLSCQSSGEESASESAPPVVEITAQGYKFQGVPDTLPAGWNTLRLINEGNEVHFAILQKIPDNKGVADFTDDVSDLHVRVLRRHWNGEIEKSQIKEIMAKNAPEWAASIESMGGTGMIDPGDTTRATMRLTPGTYVVGCYIKTPEGVPHVSLGMVDGFTVSDDTTEAAPPTPDLELTLWNDTIQTAGTLGRGPQTVAVHFREHPTVGKGNDVHMARLTETTNIDALRAWMDFRDADGLRAPAPVDFLAGTQEMPVGYTSYFTMDLRPGTYAWITETAATTVRVKPFSVP